MNKNTVKRLADNPHYSMNEQELEALAELLREEAEAEKKAETKKPAPEVKLNKNRVKKDFVKLEKSSALKEVDEDESDK